MATTTTPTASPTTLRPTTSPSAAPLTHRQRAAIIAGGLLLLSVAAVGSIAAYNANHTEAVVPATSPGATHGATDLQMMVHGQAGSLTTSQGGAITWTTPRGPSAASLPGIEVSHGHEPTVASGFNQPATVG